MGMVVPFGLGAAVAVGLYKYVEETKEEDGVGFGVFVLFVGLAMAITVGGERLILKEFVRTDLW